MKVLRKLAFYVQACLFGVLLPQLASAYDCTQMGSELFAYLATPGSHTLTVEKSGTTHRFDGGIYGSFGRKAQTFGAISPASVAIDMDVTFSNRGNFAGSRKDKQRINFYKTGEVEVILQSWGNTQLWLDNVSCYKEGIISGSIWENNGKSRVTITVVKS